MNNTGDGGTPAVFDIGSSTCDRTGCRNAAEEGRTDITDTLGYQLHIGTVVGIDHTVSHNTGQQRFNGCKDCNGDTVCGSALKGS